VCSIENTQRLNKQKTSDSAYCILAAVTYKTTDEKLHRYYGLAMQILG